MSKNTSNKNKNTQSSKGKQRKNKLFSIQEKFLKLMEARNERNKEIRKERKIRQITKEIQKIEKYIQKTIAQNTEIAEKIKLQKQKKGDKAKKRQEILSNAQNSLRAKLHELNIQKIAINPELFSRQYNALNKNYKRKKDKFGKKSQIVTQLKTQIVKLNKNLINFRKQENQQKLEAEKQKNKELKREYDELLEFSNNIKKNSSDSQKLQQLQKDYDNKLNGSNKVSLECANKLVEIDKKNIELKKDVRDYEEKCEDLESIGDQRIFSNPRLEESNRKLEREIEQLEESLKNLEAQYEEEQLNSLKERLSSAQAENLQYKKILKNLEKQISGKGSDDSNKNKKNKLVSQKNKETQKLESYNKLEENYEQLKNEDIKNTEEIKQLKHRVFELEKELQIHNKILQDLKTTKKENDNLRIKSYDLNEELNEIGKTNKIVRDIINLRELIQNNYESIASVNDNIKDSLDRQKDLKKEFEWWKNHTNALENRDSVSFGEASKLKEEEKRLLTEETKLEKRKRELESKISNISQSKKSENYLELEKKLFDVTAEKLNLKGQIDEKKQIKKKEQEKTKKEKNLKSISTKIYKQQTKQNNKEKGQVVTIDNKNVKHNEKQIAVAKDREEKPRKNVSKFNENVSINQKMLEASNKKNKQEEIHKQQTTTLKDSSKENIQEPKGSKKIKTVKDKPIPITKLEDKTPQKMPKQNKKDKEQVIDIQDNKLVDKLQVHKEPTSQKAQPEQKLSTVSIKDNKENIEQHVKQTKVSKKPKEKLNDVLNRTNKLPLQSKTEKKGLVKLTPEPIPRKVVASELKNKLFKGFFNITQEQKDPQKKQILEALSPIITKHIQEFSEKRVDEEIPSEYKNSLINSIVNSSIDIVKKEFLHDEKYLEYITNEKDIYLDDSKREEFFSYVEEKAEKYFKTPLKKAIKEGLSDKNIELKYKSEPQSETKQKDNKFMDTNLLDESSIDNFNLSEFDYNYKKGLFVRDLYNQLKGKKILQKIQNKIGSALTEYETKLPDDNAREKFYEYLADEKNDTSAKIINIVEANKKNFSDIQQSIENEIFSSFEDEKGITRSQNQHIDKTSNVLKPETELTNISSGFILSKDGKSFISGKDNSLLSDFEMRIIAESEDKYEHIQIEHAGEKLSILKAKNDEIFNNIISENLFLDDLTINNINDLGKVLKKSSYSGLQEKILQTISPQEKPPNLSKQSNLQGKSDKLGNGISSAEISPKELEQARQLQMQWDKSKEQDVEAKEINLKNQINTKQQLEKEIIKLIFNIKKWHEKYGRKSFRAEITIQKNREYQNKIKKLQNDLKALKKIEISSEKLLSQEPKKTQPLSNASIQRLRLEKNLSIKQLEEKVKKLTLKEEELRKVYEQESLRVKEEIQKSKEYQKKIKELENDLKNKKLEPLQQLNDELQQGIKNLRALKKVNFRLQELLKKDFKVEKSEFSKVLGELRRDKGSNYDADHAIDMIGEALKEDVGVSNLQKLIEIRKKNKDTVDDSREVSKSEFDKVFDTIIKNDKKYKDEEIIQMINSAVEKDLLNYSEKTKAKDIEIIKLQDEQNAIENTRKKLRGESDAKIKELEILEKISPLQEKIDKLDNKLDGVKEATHDKSKKERLEILKNKIDNLSDKLSDDDEYLKLNLATLEDEINELDNQLTNLDSLKTESNSSKKKKSKSQKSQNADITQNTPKKLLLTRTISTQNLENQAKTIKQSIVEQQENLAISKLNLQALKNAQKELHTLAKNQDIPKGFVPVFARLPNGKLMTSVNGSIIWMSPKLLLNTPNTKDYSIYGISDYNNKRPLGMVVDIKNEQSFEKLKKLYNNSQMSAFSMLNNSDILKDDFTIQSIEDKNALKNLNKNLSIVLPAQLQIEHSLPDKLEKILQENIKPSSSISKERIKEQKEIKEQKRKNKPKKKKLEKTQDKSLMSSKKIEDKSKTFKAIKESKEGILEEYNEKLDNYIKLSEQKTKELQDNYKKLVKFIELNNSEFDRISTETSEIIKDVNTLTEKEKNKYKKELQRQQSRHEREIQKLKNKLNKFENAITSDELQKERERLEGISIIYEKSNKTLETINSELLLITKNQGLKLAQLPIEASKVKSKVKSAKSESQEKELKTQKQNLKPVKEDIQPETRNKEDLFEETRQILEMPEYPITTVKLRKKPSKEEPSEQLLPISQEKIALNILSSLLSDKLVEKPWVKEEKNKKNINFWAYEKGRAISDGIIKLFTEKTANKNLTPEQSQALFNKILKTSKEIIGKEILTQDAYDQEKKQYEQKSQEEKKGKNLNEQIQKQLNEKSQKQFENFLRDSIGAIIDEELIKQRTIDNASSTDLPEEKPKNKNTKLFKTQSQSLQSSIPLDENAPDLDLSELSKLEKSQNKLKSSKSSLDTSGFTNTSTSKNTVPEEIPKPSKYWEDQLNSLKPTLREVRNEVLSIRELMELYKIELEKSQKAFEEYKKSKLEEKEKEPKEILKPKELTTQENVEKHEIPKQEPIKNKLETHENINKQSDIQEIKEPLESNLAIEKNINIQNIPKERSTTVLGNNIKSNLIVFDTMYNYVKNKNISEKEHVPTITKYFLGQSQSDNAEDISNLNHEVQKAIDNALNNELLQKVPPKKVHNHTDEYVHNKAKLIQTIDEQGNVTFTTEGKFSGIVRVDKPNSTDQDIIEFEDGKAIAVTIGKGKSKIHSDNLKKLQIEASEFITDRIPAGKQHILKSETQEINPSSLRHPNLVGKKYGKKYGKQYTGGHQTHL